jgi:hypothetical protein
MVQFLAQFFVSLGSLARNYKMFFDPGQSIESYTVLMLMTKRIRIMRFREQPDKDQWKELRLVSQHIRDGEAKAARTRELVAWLEDCGQSSKQAEALLSILEIVVQDMRNYKNAMDVEYRLVH